MEEYVSCRPGDPNVPEKTAVKSNMPTTTLEPEDSKQKLPRVGPASSAALKILS